MLITISYFRGILVANLIGGAFNIVNVFQTLRPLAEFILSIH